MSYPLWLFLIYSFLGFCLEKLFARAVHSPRQVRKCFLLLPLCPVYGLAMLAVLALHRSAFPFWMQVLSGGLVCTAVEYLVHLYYDKVFHTRFWDYSDLSIHLNGRVCPHFSLIWGILSTLTVRYAHPLVSFAAQSIPPWTSFAAWLLLASDAVLTCSLLYRFHDTELLSVSALLSQE